MHGYQVPASPSLQTWAMSIGFKMEPLRGNCKVMWFSININARGYATGALQHNLFSLPSDPARQWLLYANLYKQILFFTVLLQQRSV